MQQSVNDSVFLRYKELFESLRVVITSSEQRVLSEPPDILFIDNVNFFVKSYLISICSYLEAYLQDIAFMHTQLISKRVSDANIPHNFIHWGLNTGLKDKNLKFVDISFQITKKDISEQISANPYRTLKLFQLLGVDLTRRESFEINKDLINSIVTKRNNIIHHNDTAADVSFGDLVTYIDVVVPYMMAVSEAVTEPFTNN
ncbi:HEPN domain-containing protein [Vibrio parahaemolyticus]|uniref:HEPN domain-containing protein n=1 Tax=Vibrio parahaemolyticus TaxID=670 RepID=UPI00046FC3EC|nr:HEPN domain-containing protein [Vibrio parahaemolyticus]